MSAFSPTPAEDYPIRREEEVELPSGARVLLKRPSVFLMVRLGQVPPDVKEIIDRSSRPEEDPPSEAEILTILDFFVAASYVSPKVSFKRKKGFLCVEDLPDADRLAIVSRFDLRSAV